LNAETGSFGIEVLDERVSGPVRGGLIALIGGAGTGKTIAGLQFLAEGVRRGGRVAHVTQARPQDVVELARSIGIDLVGHLGSGRWTLLAYQPGFRERYRRTIEPGEVFEELEAFLSEGEEAAPERLLIDTCGPLVELREASNGAELLVDTLARLGSTTLLTFSAEFPAALDSAFDLISQRASLILHVTMTGSGRRQFLVRKTLGPHDASGPISFDIRDGKGIVPFEPIRRERSSDVQPEVRRRVLLLDVTGELPDALRVWFEKTFEFFYTSDPVDAFPELARRKFGVVALNVDRRSVNRGLHILRQLRRAASQPPMLIMCGYGLRASDRARALRSGADDFVSGGLNPEELASRIEALLRRGRATSSEDAELEEPPAPTRAPGVKVERVTDIVRARLEAPGAAIFSLILLRPTNGKKLPALAKHVAENMRQQSEDRMCVSGDRVEVYLDGALGTHAERFIDRVRTDGWKKVAAVIYTSPTDREQLLRIVEQQDG
jgi:KaiC/GvpD/RAD55 family RecA-like ATPase/DNA-binding NarL/FixJ family response regulator